MLYINIYKYIYIYIAYIYIYIYISIDTCERAIIQCIMAMVLRNVITRNHIYIRTYDDDDDDDAILVRVTR